MSLELCSKATFNEQVFCRDSRDNKEFCLELDGTLCIHHLSLQVSFGLSVQDSQGCRMEMAFSAARV